MVAARIEVVDEDLCRKVTWRSFAGKAEETRREWKALWITATR